MNSVILSVLAGTVVAYTRSYFCDITGAAAGQG